MKNRLEAMNAKEKRVSHTMAKVETQAECFVYDGFDHLARDCPTYGEIREMYEEHCNALSMYGKPFSPDV